MLGKQGWRLLTQPSSLAAKVFKARYYSKGTFLSASLGPNPSFVWRSIVASHSLISNGSRWKVGTGNDINIIRDPWLHDQQPFVTSHLQGLDRCNVATLMVPNERRWDVDLIRDIFNDRDAGLIMDIPLLQSSSSDTIVWLKEVSGCYSVKSTYRFIQELSGNWRGEDVDSFWKIVWRTKLPPKIKDFVWRAIMSCLPTMAQLQTKRINAPAYCPQCQNSTEIIYHCLVDCEQDNFMQCSAEDRGVLSTICWSIWRARNMKVWNNKATNPTATLISATTFLSQWKNAQTPVVIFFASGLNEEDGAESGFKPPIFTLKVNVDDAIFEGARSFRLSWVARDISGFLVEGRTRLERGSLDPPTIEAMSIREAFSWLKYQPSQHNIVESDCLMVVQAIRSTCHMLSLFGDVISECKTLLKSLPHTKVIFVKRSANKVAHSFAKASLSYPDHTFSMGNIPSVLLPVLITDFEVS